MMCAVVVNTGNSATVILRLEVTDLFRLLAVRRTSEPGVNGAVYRQRAHQGTVHAALDGHPSLGWR